MNRLRLAVIGTGALGRHHARILAAQPDIELTAVVDKSAENGNRVAEACGTRWASDPAEVLDLVDAAVIAVPTRAHRPVAEQFLERGIPVLVEKPLAADLDDARALVELADRRGVPLQVGHVERFNPATVAAKALCGVPKYVRSERLSPFSFRSTDIGVVHDLMIHDLDLLLDLVGAPVVSVEALGLALMGPGEDVVQARIRFATGCIADLTASRISPQPRRAMQIWSAAGAVTVDFTTREVQRFSPTAAFPAGPTPVELAGRPGADLERLKQQVFGEWIECRRADVPADDALTAELRSFLDAVRTGSAPEVDGHQALAALELADRVVRSVAAHAWNGVEEGPTGPHVATREPLRRAG